MSDSNLSYVTYTGDGETTSFTFSVSGEDIGYIRTSDIKGYVNGVEVEVSLDAATPHIVEFSEAPESGSKILIRRIMGVAKPYVTFSKGNDYSNSNVNNTNRHLLYIIQEFLDGFLPEGHCLKQDLSLGGYRLVAVGDPVEDQDAVTLSYFNEDKESQETRLDDLENSLDSGDYIYRRVTFTAEEGQEVFDLNADVENILSVYINGVHQIAGEAYELVGARNLQTLPLEVGDRVVAVIGQDITVDHPVQVDLRYFREVVFATEGMTEYTSPYSFEQVLSVYINGIHQSSDYAFSYDSETNTVTFAEGIEAGDEIVLVLGQEPEEASYPSVVQNVLDLQSSSIKDVDGLDTITLEDVVAGTNSTVDILELLEADEATHVHLCVKVVSDSVSAGSTVLIKTEDLQVDGWVIQAQYDSIPFYSCIRVPLTTDGTIRVLADSSLSEMTITIKAYEG